VTQHGTYCNDACIHNQITIHISNTRSWHTHELKILCVCVAWTQRLWTCCLPIFRCFSASLCLSLLLSRSLTCSHKNSTSSSYRVRACVCVSAIVCVFLVSVCVCVCFFLSYISTLLPSIVGLAFKAIVGGVDFIHRLYHLDIVYNVYKSKRKKWKYTHTYVHTCSDNAPTNKIWHRSRTRSATARQIFLVGALSLIHRCKMCVWYMNINYCPCYLYGVTRKKCSMNVHVYTHTYIHSQMCWLGVCILHQTSSTASAICVLRYTYRMHYGRTHIYIHRCVLGVCIIYERHLLPVPSIYRVTHTKWIMNLHIHTYTCAFTDVLIGCVYHTWTSSTACALCVALHTKCLMNIHIQVHAYTYIFLLDMWMIFLHCMCVCSV